jgi:hypothetical protein
MWNLAAFSRDRAVVEGRDGHEFRARMCCQKFFDLVTVGASEADAEFFHEQVGRAQNSITTPLQPSKRWLRDF